MNPMLAHLLDSLRSHIGWAETGGRIIRDQFSGDVIGRTKWIARSDFWQDRPEPISEREAHAAIDHAVRLERMSPKQRRFVRYAVRSIIAQYVQQREDMDERRAIMREGFGL